MVTDQTAGSPIDQFRRYAGDSGTFAFTPAVPINTTMDDGTVLSYSTIQGSYAIVNGVPTIKLVTPLPQVQAHKFFMRFNAAIQDAQYVPPSSVAIGTTRGRYTIKLEAAP